MGLSAIISLIVFVIVVIGILSQKIDKTLISMLGAVFSFNNRNFFSSDASY